MIFESPRPPITVPNVSLPAYLLGDLGDRGDRPALIDGPTGRTLTYAELRTAASHAGRALRARGLERGGIVALCSPNVPEYAIAFFGVAMAGGCTTTLNPLNTEDELIHQLRDSGARWYVTIPQLVDRARAVAAQTDIEEIFVFGEAEGATPFDDLVATGAGLAADDAMLDEIVDPGTDLVALPYSSGTTGRPKGVMLTHENLVANIEQFLTAAPGTPDDVVIAVLPFFHIYGMVVVMSGCLRTGATVVTMPRFDFEAFLETMQTYGVTTAFVVPPIILALAKHPLVDQYDLSSLREIMSGAAPLGADLAAACRDRLGTSVYQGYGMTEASPVTHCCPKDIAPERVGSVGPVVSSTEMMIVDLETGEPLGPGGRGEVWIRGPQVMLGYLNRPDATAQTVDEDGWLHTGDVGIADEHGYTTIVDRAKELIKYKGYQVAPAELEDLLLSHPAVQDAAVIPHPDDEAGEVPKAFIVRSGDVDETALHEFVAERVAPYKKIRYFEFVDEIPKSASGKILRRVLVEQERNR